MTLACTRDPSVNIYGFHSCGEAPDLRFIKVFVCVHNKYLLIKKFKSKNYEATFMARAKFFFVNVIDILFNKKMSDWMLHIWRSEKSVNY